MIIHVINPENYKIQKLSCTKNLKISRLDQTDMNFQFCPHLLLFNPVIEIELLPEYVFFIL